jgi:hypothetical protein
MGGHEAAILPRLEQPRGSGQSTRTCCRAGIETLQARFPLDEWRQRLAAGFQDFARLQLLSRESIGVRDLEQMAHDESILAALTGAAENDLPSTLPSALETQLGREFQAGSTCRSDSGRRWRWAGR